MRKSHSFTKEQYDSILKGITDVGGRIISDINAFERDPKLQFCILMKHIESLSFRVGFFTNSFVLLKL